MKDGVEQPIEFVSKSLAKEQLRWSTPEKEAFAILFAFTKLEHLLRDTFFTLRTDHKNLLYINSAGSQKVQRWKLRIQEYDFQIEHIAGINNIAADFLSRLCSRPVEEALQSAESTNTPQIEVDCQIQYNPLLLLRKGREDPQITRKIASVHNSRAGHHGVERTIELLYRQNETWRYMREDVKQFIRNCPLCQKMSYLKVPIVTQKFTTSTRFPMQRLNIDSIGPLPMDTAGNTHILVIIDCFTRWWSCMPSKTLP